VELAQHCVVALQRTDSIIPRAIVSVFSGAKKSEKGPEKAKKGGTNGILSVPGGQ